jgi:hypothetical protein
MNMNNNTSAIHATPPCTNKPAEKIKAAPAQKRNSFTRSPVWSLNQPQP